MQQREFTDADFLITYRKLLVAISAQFPDDESRPSVTCSYLGRDGKFYASIVRYTEGYGKGKVVVLARTAPSLEQAVTQLAEEFVGLAGAREDLRRHLRGDR